MNLQIKEKVKGIPTYVKEHWNTPAEGEYLSLKEFLAYTISSSGSKIYLSIANLITFSAGYFSGAVMGIATIDFSIISIISTVVGYIFMFLNPIHILIYENHGRLTKKWKIFAHISFLAELFIGIGCYFIPQDAFENIIHGLPQLVGNMLVVGGITAYLNWGIRRLFCAKYGRYKPFSLVCLFPSAIMLSLIPYLPVQNLSYTNKLIVLHFAFTLMSWFFNNSVYVDSIITFITPNSQERQKLISIVPIFSQLLSSIMGMVLPIIITTTGGYLSLKTYKVFVPIFAIVGAVICFALVFCKERIIEEPVDTRKKVKFGQGALNCIKNKYLWITKISNLFGSWQWFVDSLLSWWFVYSLRMEWFSGIAANIVVVGVTLGNIMTPVLTKRFEKKNIIIIVRGLTLITVLAVAFAVKFENIWIFLVALFFKNTIQPITNGVGSGLGADIMDYHQWKYGERSDSISSVLDWVLNPIGVGFGYIMPWLLAKVGFTSDWNVLFDSTILKNVFSLYTWGTIAGIVLLTFPFLFYDLTREKHEICVRELKERLENTKKEENIEAKGEISL